MILKSNMQSLTVIVIILHGLIYASSADYNLDILEVEWNTTTPDLVDVNLHPVQPTRGIFGVSGYIDFKEDINTDTTLAQVKVFYSSNGISYQLSPFRIPQQPFTKALNSAYKEYLMERMVECCENPPQANIFVSPLTKRFIKCDECLFPSDNLPSTMRPGYYRLVIMIYDKPEVAISVLLKLELD